MCYKNDKNIKFVITRFVFPGSKCTKIRFRPRIRPDPAGGAYDAAPDPVVGWGGGYPLPIPLPALELGASVLRPPSTQNPGYATAGTLDSGYAIWTVF